MLIGVPRERDCVASETRVAVTPETAKKLVAMRHTVCVQAGAGEDAGMTDSAYTAAGAVITDRFSGGPAREFRQFCRNPSKGTNSPYSMRRCSSSAGDWRERRVTLAPWSSRADSPARLQCGRRAPDEPIPAVPAAPVRETGGLHRGFRAGCARLRLRARGQARQRTAPAVPSRRHRRPFVPPSGRAAA